MRYRRAWQVEDGLPVWGRCLVHKTTQETLTTIVYTPGSFAPLIRIDQNRQYMLKEEEQKSERERAMQGKSGSDPHGTTLSEIHID